jgi:hypothetical protein
VKRLMCNIRQNRWCITRGTQLERRVLPLESRSYNKSYPSPKAYYFSKIDDQKPFSRCLNPRLTFLCSVYISFPPARLYSLLHIYDRATMLCFCMCLLITMFPISAWVSPILSHYPTECRSTFEPCHHDLTRAFM